ncbi:MAG: TonB-dependent receptor [Crocinitomicaceae bacterium]|nr:TonB-dependent receptor [Crocinitomicaceae bacterium]
MKNTKLHIGICLFLFNLLLRTTVYGQELRVLNASDGKPIEDVIITIVNKQEQKSTKITNNNGVIDLKPCLDYEFPLLILMQHSNFDRKIDTLKIKEHRTYRLKPKPFVIFDEVAVTAQYMPKITERAVHNIHVIDRQKIESMGAQNIRDLFTNELNIRMQQDFALGTAMSLQGVSGQNVKILIDGVPLTGRLNGNIDISQINLNNVERVEIIEGPLSVSYGTDALAGTINIITKKDMKNNLDAMVYGYYESIGQYNSNARFGWREKGHTVTLNGGRNYFDGWSPTDRNFDFSNTFVADSSRFQQWNPKEQVFGTFNYSYQKNNTNINYVNDLFWEEVLSRGRPRPPFEISAFDDYFITRRLNQAMHFNHVDKGRGFRINGMAAVNQFRRIKNTYFIDLTTLDRQLSPNKSDQDTSVFNNVMSRATFNTLRDSAWINFEVGYDINHEVGFGPRILGERQNIGDYALFSTAEIQPFAALTIRPGVRAIHNTAYEAPLVPSLNIKYDILDTSKKNKGMTVRGAYARGFRAPDLKELYFYFVDINHNIQGNPNLSAETSHNWNGSLSYWTRRTGREYKAKISGFYNQINDMIGLAQANLTEFSYFNINRFETIGAQVTTDWVHNNFRFQVGGSYIGRYNNFSAEEMSPSRDRFFFSPEGQLNAQYKFQKTNSTLSFFYKYTGQMPLVRVGAENELFLSVIDDFHTFDATYQQMLFKNRWNWTLGVRNIFNVTNIQGFMPGGAHSAGSNSMAVAMGRSFFTSLTFQISK